MSGGILNYSPGSKTFVPRGTDGRYAPKVIGAPTAGAGAIRNVPAHPPPGPTVLTQRPATKSRP